MNFGWTDRQRLYRDEVLRFATSDLRHDVAAADAEAVFPREAWRKCAAFGLLGLPVPERYGGAGADALTVVAALEALGYGCTDNGLVFSMNAQMWACEMPIVRFGTEEQKRRYLPGLCDGSSIGAHATSEPSAGSDAFSLRTRARKRGRHWVLDGAKTFVTNGPVADVFVVFATMDPGRRIAGLCAFLVPRDAAGLSVGPPLRKMGLRTSPMSELFLADCEIPEEQLLGEPGAGMAVWSFAMHWERGCILACAVGAMQRQFERAIAWSRDRKRSGALDGSFGVVAHRIVDMKLRLESARRMLYRFGWLLDTGASTALDAAVTKLHLSESFVQSSLDALSLHGGYGDTTEREIERDLRDAIAGRLYSGTSEIQRNLVALQLGLS